MQKVKIVIGIISSIIIATSQLNAMSYIKQVINNHPAFKLEKEVRNIEKNESNEVNSWSNFRGLFNRSFETAFGGIGFGGVVYSAVTIANRLFKKKKPAPGNPGQVKPEPVAKAPTQTSAVTPNETLEQKVIAPFDFKDGAPDELSQTIETDYVRKNGAVLVNVVMDDGQFKQIEYSNTTEERSNLDRIRSNSFSFSLAEEETYTPIITIEQPITRNNHWIDERASKKLEEMQNEETIFSKIVGDNDTIKTAWEKTPKEVSFYAKHTLKTFLSKHSDCILNPISVFMAMLEENRYDLAQVIAQQFPDRFDLNWIKTVVESKDFKPDTLVEIILCTKLTDKQLREISGDDRSLISTIMDIADNETKYHALKSLEPMNFFTPGLNLYHSGQSLLSKANEILDPGYRTLIVKLLTSWGARALEGEVIPDDFDQAA